MALKRILDWSYAITATIVLASGKLAAENNNGTHPSKCLTGAVVEMTATPSVVSYGQTSTLRWNVQLPKGCSVNVQLNGKTVAYGGTEAVTPVYSGSYILILSKTEGGVFGERNANANVTVTYPTVVTIDQNTPEPSLVLQGALNSGNAAQTIEFCTDIDLTGLTAIRVGDSVTLQAGSACARSPRAFGPRIFVTDHRTNNPLFIITGDHVTFKGFRLQGPTNGIGEGDDIDEKGIVIAPAAAAAPVESIEISNMEIYYWSGEGIQVTDNQSSAPHGRLTNRNVAAVHIFGNFIHDNQHQDKNGYGVESADGAYALIEQNVFDKNRHDIAGGSVASNKIDYSGYTVQDNLILSAGGKDCAGTNLRFLCAWKCGCWQTHQIDMHGDGNKWYSKHNWECGTAGETLLIKRNTILYTSGPAITIRGNPADRAVVDGNIFKQTVGDGAITQEGACGGWGDNITNPIQVSPNNEFGVDPMN
jgi:hypothetical protein